jgi:Methyltransferase domain
MLLFDKPWVAKKWLASRVFPKYSLFVDKLNYNAKVADWLRNNKAVPTFENKNDLYGYIVGKYLKGQPIDYLEFGVQTGYSFKMWLKANQHAESRFYGFDTFTGLPEDWTKLHKQGAFDAAGQIPDVNDSRAQFVKGLFQDTLRSFLGSFQRQNRIVVNIDSNLYSSALYTLASMDDLLTTGDIIIFDEFSSALHEYRAWHDYLSAFRRTAQPIVKSGDFAEKAAFIIA